jgi:hypothetical protein
VTLLFALIVLLAATTWVARRWRARARRRALRVGPGSSLDEAIAVRSFDQIDSVVAARRCACGQRLRATGEGTRARGPRRYRLTRLACDDCEEETVLFFDVSELVH